jgi:hypothetical protein
LIGKAEIGTAEEPKIPAGSRRLPAQSAILKRMDPIQQKQTKITKSRWNRDWFPSFASVQKSGTSGQSAIAAPAATGPYMPYHTRSSIEHKPDFATEICGNVIIVVTRVISDTCDGEF